MPKLGKWLQHGNTAAFWRQTWRQKTMPDVASSCLKSRLICFFRLFVRLTAFFGDMFDVENYWICIHLFFSQILTLKFNDKHIKWRKMQHDRLWRVTSRSCVSYYRHCIRQILDVWHGIKNVNPRTSRWHILPCLVSLCMQDSYSQSLRQLRHVTYPLLYTICPLNEII